MKKTTKIISLLLVIVLVCGCKRDGWLDWKVENQLWLQENAKKEGVVTTPTGLQYKCIDAGWDKSARPDDAKIVTIDYEGKLINGYVFDANQEYAGYVNYFNNKFWAGGLSYPYSSKDEQIIKTKFIYYYLKSKEKYKAIDY